MVVALSAPLQVGTVAILRVSEVAANLPLAYGVLGEKFTQRDVIATSCCIGSRMIGGSRAIPPIQL